MRFKQFLTEAGYDDDKNYMWWEDFSEKITDEISRLLDRELHPRYGDCFAIAAAMFLAAKKLGKNVVIIGDESPHAAVYDTDSHLSIDGSGVYEFDDALEYRRSRTWKTLNGFVKTAKNTSSDQQASDIDKVIAKYT